MNPADVWGAVATLTTVLATAVGYLSYRASTRAAERLHNNEEVAQLCREAINEAMKPFILKVDALTTQIAVLESKVDVFWRRIGGGAI
jgi:hypothetical protein